MAADYAFPPLPETPKHDFCNDDDWISSGTNFLVDDPMERLHPSGPRPLSEREKRVGTEVAKRGGL
jgi:hypothetical protein